MAIDIEWQVKPPTKKGETNQPQLFPRIVNADVVGDAELADKIAAHSGLSRGVVTNVLEDLADVLATMMHEGKEVSLSSIGRFRLSIGTDADISPDTVNSTRKICVRGINFQPSDTLLNAIANPSFRQVARNASVVAPSTEQMLPLLDAFLQSHPTFSSTEFATHFNLKRPTAIARLNELMGMQVIRKEGSGRDTKYRKNTLVV